MVRPTVDAGVGAQASFLRKEFDLANVGGNERLLISAQGLYRAFINGKRVGEDVLTPGWTCYDVRLSYQTYDIADLLRPGRNVIDIWLADGWYRSRMMWPSSNIINCWGDKIGAIAEIRGDGLDPILATDGSWKSGLLPILKSGIYFGEIYDARQEDLPAIGGGEVLPFDKSILVAHETTGVMELEPLPVVSSFTDEEGRTVYDFGQNSAGYVAFTVAGEPGAQIVVDHAEILDKHGQFDRASLRTAEARIEYVLKGGDVESYRPYFTFQGFRYARITIEGRAEIKSIASVPVSSAAHPTAAFTSGHPLVNRLVENTLWSQRANFVEVPTDCPQRDERLGWTGDAQVFAPTACYLNDSETFLRKWLRDVMADQREDGAIAHVTPDPTRMHPQAAPGFFGSTGWGDVICVIPHVLYEHYGDASVFEETLPAMVKWVDFVWSISDGPIVKPPRGWGKRGFTFGDWLQPSGPSVKPLPTIGDDAAATIYLYISSVLTARAAEIVGDDAVAQRMGERAEAVKKAFMREFVTGSGRLAYDDQTSYALAFMHDLIPAEHVEAAKGYFKAAIARCDGRIGTGFIGTPALLPALVKIGETELAGQVFLQEELPGWLYQVKKGATTIWERWDAVMPDGSTHPEGMNSYNHYAYGAVCQWLFEAVAGFRPDPEMPGFKRIIFEPTVIAALSPVAAHHDSRVGRIEAGWALDGNKVAYDVSVPEGAEGLLVLAPDYRDIVVDGSSVLTAADGGKTTARLSPGRHEISFRVQGN
ncbi:alpha-L-rhamnosidase [Devosia nitrariae]|nr:alpha-L-rhamnosidase [Devosia nitrariae]